MTIDDAILELDSIRARHGGGTTLPEWAAGSIRAAGFATSPPMPAGSPLFARLPTSREYAEKLTPAVRRAMREAKAGGLGGFLIRALPIIKQIVEIILMLLPLFAMAQAQAGAMRAPGPGFWPWRDEEGDIPEDVKRAARMED